MGANLINFLIAKDYAVSKAGMLDFSFYPKH